MQEYQLISLCCKGNPSAFKKLYESYAAYVYTICKRYGIDENACPDMMQEVFANVFTSIRNYDSNKGSLKSWIRSIAVHKILTFKRIKILNIVSLEELQDWTLTENEAINRLDQEDLVKLINKMPVGYRTVFNLYVVDGYSHDEIAKLLKVKPETSRSQLLRARKWLQKNLENYYARAKLMDWQSQSIW